ncbi:MAG: ABC transporter ATP-binding protein [Provencibacterium sp.]|jgi:ATP-binding cassette subfamily B multidrug efflux pump|nr:ABC transporter ATP-binding protein [Provencibacterium sp.]
MHLSWIWENLQGYRKRYILGFILAVIFPLTSLINPNFSRMLIDRVLVGGETELLVPLVVTMIGVTFVRMLIGYAMMGLFEVSSQGLVYNLRLKLYKHLQELDMSFYDRYRTGDLMTTLTSDVDMVRHNVNYVFRTFVSSTLMFLAATVYFLSINVKFTLVLIAVTPFILIVSRRYLKKVRHVYVELRERLSLLNTDAQENIEGNRVVKAFANEQYEIEKFEKKNQDFHDQNLAASYMWLRFYPWIETLSQSMTITIMLFGGIFLIRGELTSGEFLAFSSLSWAVCDPFRQLGDLLNNLQRFFASAGKIIEIQSVDPKISSKPNAKTSDHPLCGEVEFRNVSYRFSGQPVLENISFHIKPGETVAFMGETGCGKTTIINLLSRFYDVSKGAIWVDGVDVRDWDLKTLRSNIGMATQDVFLFSDTVDGNIAYGDPDLPDEQVRWCAGAAAAQFIEGMSEGYDTIIGERGVGLSGGQKQRIALARALALSPPILILDDTTSAVDMETEKYIQQQLENLPFPCTKIIIAQRISSVKKADHIFVLKNHQIVESGTHRELIEKRGYYYDIYRIQSGIEEVGQVG